MHFIFIIRCSVLSERIGKDYVENNQETIIEPEVFEMVQREIMKRGRGKKYHSGVRLFSTKIKCSCYRSWYDSKVWHSNSKYHKVIWQFNHKFDNDEPCDTPRLYEDGIKVAFLSAANQLLSFKNSVIADAEEMMTAILDISVLKKEQDELLEETQLISEIIQAAIWKNATVALDQTKYQKRYDNLSTKFDK